MGKPPLVENWTGQLADRPWPFQVTTPGEAIVIVTGDVFVRAVSRPATVTRNAYDGFGNLLAVTADAGPGRLNLQTSYGYDSRGDVVSVTDPRGNVTTGTWDEARRPLTSTLPSPTASPTPGVAGLTTTNTWDAQGRLLQVRQSAGGSVLATSSATYTPTGKPATVTDANGNTTRFAYDLLDRRSAVTDALGRVTRFTYTVLGQPFRTYAPGGSADPLLEQTWTDDGLPATLADANGNVTAFAYDGFDRLVTTTYPGGSSESLTYDALDNVLTRTTRAGDTIAFAYDTLNRLVSKAVAGGTTVSYGYDLAGRTTNIGDDSTALTSAVPPGGSTVAYMTSYTYDALNRPTGVVFSDVPAATPPPAGALVAFGHSYNAVNQRIGQTVSDSTWLAYPAATPSTTSYTANSLNQYTTVGAVTPTYDANGNLTFDGTGTYGYDAENRLVSASGGVHTASYRYDAQGRRSARTVDGTTTVSVTDADDREVLEYDGTTGQVLRWHAYGLGPNAVLGQMDVVAGTRTMPIPDLLGSVIASVDAGSGTISKSGYLPYGTSAAAATPFGFTGQRFDAETGFYYYRARHYSTVFGRFLQTDPVGYVAGVNLYAYVGNDPLNAVDPTGLASEHYSGSSLGAWGSGWDWGAGVGSPSSSTFAASASTYDLSPTSPSGGLGSVALPPSPLLTMLPTNPGGSGRGSAPSGSAASQFVGSLQPPPAAASERHSLDQSPIQLAGDISGFTKHGINQAINRGVSPAAILDAVVNPLQILPQANGTVRYIGQGAVVVLNPAGRVVTVWGQ